MTSSRSRSVPATVAAVALSVGLAVVPASAPAAAPSYAIPLKNTTYQAKVTDSTGIKIKATVKVGAVTKVTKLVIKLSCAAGKNKLVRKNLPIDQYGSFFHTTAPVEQVSGQWKSKHKLEGHVYADESKPCGGYNLDYTAKD